MNHNPNQSDIDSAMPLPSELLNNEIITARHDLMIKQQAATDDQLREQFLQKTRQFNQAQEEADLNATGTASDIAQYKLNKYLSLLPQHPPVGLLEKATSFITAMASAIVDARPSFEKQQARLAICTSCDQFEPEIDRPSKVGWCKACGCGKNPMSTLAFKATIALSTCPLKLWDQKTEEPATVLPPSPAPPETEKVESVSS